MEEFIYLALSESGASDANRGIVRRRFKITKYVVCDFALTEKSLTFGPFSREEMIFLFESSLNRLTEGLREVFMGSPYTINVRDCNLFFDLF